MIFCYILSKARLWKHVFSQAYGEEILSQTQKLSSGFEVLK